MQPKKEVTLIVGAGMTGLTAAYLLSNAGENCLLLENKEVVGGLCRSYKVDDIIFDLGPHVFLYNADIEFERFMMELLQGENIIKKRFRFAIYSKGKYWKFPPNLFDLIFYPPEYIRHFFTFFLKRGKKQHDDGYKSLAMEITEKGGQSYYETVFASMLLKKALLPGSEIHRDWMIKLIDRDIKNRKERIDIKLSRRKFFKKFLKSMFYQTYYYPSKGFETFPQKLWEKYKQLGGQTILDCGPISFEKSGNRIVSVKVKDTVYPVKDVIWTGSVNTLNEILSGKTPKMEYIKTIIAFLTYTQKKAVNRPFVYVYHSDDNLIFNRIYYPASIYGKQTPPGKEGICLELNYTQDMDNIDDNNIIQHTVSDVEKMGLFNKSDFRKGQVVRLGECLPIYGLDYESKMAETFKEIHSYRNLYSVGRLGGYFFCQTPFAVNQGIKIANHLLQHHSDSKDR